ncbi:ATP-binding protein [Lactococcus lactis]|uniref:ATP-binding protein n=1 Tax=Lactococcus lactis TaxID=1358 RepID=UPI0028919C9E|nr:ATP-binding protein [Lactococcus lactis]MDT2920018.1 ATP-binding protein [Lactococcus lactis]
MKNISENKLKYYQYSPENQYLDRKSARKKPKELLKHFIAFANAEGGQLVIGIEDEKQNNIITGFKDGKSHTVEEFKKIPNMLSNQVIHAIFDEYEVINYRGEKDVILVISIDVSINRVISAPDDSVYLRRNDESIKISYEQRKMLNYDKGQQFFEDEIVEYSSIDDIDDGLIEEYKVKLGALDSDTTEVLKARNLIIDGQVTKAGILLFGKYPSRFLPQARVRFIRYEGSEMRVGTDFNVTKDITFEDALPRLIIQVKAFVSTQLRDFQYLDEHGNFKVMPEYPEFAWFEGVVNAVTHRDYSIFGDYIRILMYDDRLEIHSPGKLPNIVTLENIKQERFSRNPRIARILTEFGWVREMNEGVKRIYSEMENLFLNEPIYSEPGNKVSLTLKNNILNRHIRIQDRLRNDFNSFDSLSDDEKKVIHYMYNSGSKITTVKVMELLERARPYSLKILKKLESQNIIEWHGTSKTDTNQYYMLKVKVD